MDVLGTWYTYNRRLTMSLPAAAQRQFRVNSQNDGIRYPSYNLPSSSSSSLLALLLTLYVQGEGGGGGIDLQGVRDGNSRNGLMI